MRHGTGQDRSKQTLHRPEAVSLRSGGRHAPSGHRVYERRSADYYRRRRDNGRKVITCDQDRWDPGFTVGVLGEFRLSNNFAFRIAPAMYFGNRHITLTNLTDKLENGEYVTQRQDLKTVYISSALNLLFSAPRLNNTRPYLMAGINPMINLSGKDNDYIKLKRYDVFLEFGLGCDFYLPYFKLRPELKFCYGLINSLDTSHPDKLKDQNMIMYAKSVKEARSKMIVLSFYFE